MSRIPDTALGLRETERVEEEAHLLRHALDALPQAVVVHDEKGAVVFRNRHAESLASPRHADALAARAVDDLLAAALKGAGVSRTLALYGPPRRILDLAGEAIRNADGDVVGAMVVIDDVSERRRLDDVRRDFVANVSHELRTPVGALALLAEALRDEHDETVVDRLAGRISDEAVRVGRIIEDLLDLSRMEADSSLPRDIVSLPSAVAHAIERVQQSATQRGVTIETASAAEMTEQPTVLVVEDEESFVDALCVGLRREGFIVKVARDGAEALTLFDAVRPDLVLLDLMLPKVPGVDVCRQIRARSDTP